MRHKSRVIASLVLMAAACAAALMGLRSRWQAELALRELSSALRRGDIRGALELMLRDQTIRHSQTINVMLEIIEDSFEPIWPQCLVAERDEWCAIGEQDRIEKIRRWLNTLECAALVCLARIGAEGAEGAESLRVRSSTWDPERRLRLATVLGILFHWNGEERHEGVRCDDSRIDAFRSTLADLRSDPAEDVSEAAGWALEELASLVNRGSDSAAWLAVDCWIEKHRLGSHGFTSRPWMGRARGR